jgi:hypothetical protein
MDLLEYLLVLALVARQIAISFGPFLLVGGALALLLNLRRSA